MTAHELAQKLLEGPDWRVVFEPGGGLEWEREIEYVEQAPMGSLSYIKLS